MLKRKSTHLDTRRKRTKSDSAAGPSHLNDQPPDSDVPPRPRKINKLIPPRPFPKVPLSVSATGPRSAHKEGKNYICITRKTKLGAYMRRCKDVIIKDGYKTLHLSAMGAAIPHLMHLTQALPPILPFPIQDIHMEVTTGTVEVQDEVVPDDEDEDISYETRGKSTLGVVLTIGDGLSERDLKDRAKLSDQNRQPTKPLPQRTNSNKVKNKDPIEKGAEVIFVEPEQDAMEMI